jgi:hypothetical protein
MTTIQSRLKALEDERKSLEAQLDTQRANKRFLCGCGAMHRIKDCDALRRLYYEGPHGCSGGDYWAYQELQVICPVTDSKNRFLYSSHYTTDWRLRDDYAHSAEMQFNRLYKHLFKSIADDHNKDKRSWWNNEYVDQNHKKFGIKLGATE